MPNNINQIISFQTDISDVIKQFNNLRNLNTALAKDFGSQFSKATDILAVNLERVGQSISKTGKVTEFAQLGIQFRNASGEINTFRTNLEVVNGKLQETKSVVSQTAAGLGQIAKPLSAIIQPLGRLSTEFNDLGKVNKELATNLGKNFSQATGIIEKNIDKVNQKQIKFEGKNVLVPVQQLGAVVKTTSGHFLQLTKTLTTLPNNVVKSTLAVKDLGTQFGNLVKPTKQFIEDLSGLKQLKDLDKLKQSGLSELTKSFGSDFKVLSQEIGKVSFKNFTEGANTVRRPIVEMSTVVKDAEGKLGTFKQQMALTADGIKPLNQSFVLGSKASKVFGVDILELAKRAAFTIPTWFLLRGAIIGIPLALAQGLNDLIEFDRQLQKIKRNLTGTSEEIASGFNRIRDEVTRLSLETGKSTTEIADAVKQFATLGFGVEESLSGANAAVKASALFFEDAGKTAEAFAGSMKILEDRTAGAANFSQQFNEALALAVELEKDNRSELAPLSQALQRFAPAALNAGISMKETITLLASLGTAGRGGAAGATLLRSSINELLSSLDQLAPELGVVVEESDKTFDVLLKVIDAGDRLASSGLIKDRAKVTEAFSAIFGGERGTQVVSALSSVNEQLRKNLSVLPNVNEFYRQYNDLIETSAAVQRDKLNTALTELRKGFIDAVLGGGQGLLDLLKSLNNSVETLTPALNALGGTIRAVFGNLGTIAGVAFLIKFRTILTAGAITGVFSKIFPLFAKAGATAGLLFSGTFRRTLITKIAPNLLLGLGGAGLSKVATQIAGRLLGFLANPIVGIGFLLGGILSDSIFNSFIAGQQRRESDARAAFSTLIQGLQDQLNSTDLTKLIVDVQAGNVDLGGANQVQVEGQLRKLLEGRLKAEADITKEKERQGKITSNLPQLQQDLLKQQLKSKAINEDTISSLSAQIAIYQKLAKTITLSAEQQKTLNDLQKSLLDNLSQQQAEINDTLLQDAVERFKAEGATTSQIIKATQAYRDQLGIDTSLTQQINERLSLERAINEEKRLQNRLSSDSVKLFEIAQTEGVDVARRIGEVLAGNVDFGTFFRQGGKELEVFKANFEDLFKQQQAQAFFKGDFLKGFQELRGGTRIDIPETALRQQGTPRFDTNLALQQSRAGLSQLQQLQNINVDANLNINITGLSFDKAKEKIVDEVAKAVFTKIKQPGSQERQDLNSVLEEL